MQLSVYWRFCWGLLCPVLLPLLFLYVVFTQAGVPDIPYPAQIAGWIISLIGGQGHSGHRINRSLFESSIPHNYSASANSFNTK